MIPFRVVYADCQVSDPNQDPIYGIVSPSAGKPKLIAAELKRLYPDLEFHQPIALTRDDFYRCHSKTYVDDVLDKKRQNGFRTISGSVNASLPYTNGAMYWACRLAMHSQPACALVAGFHHAGYNGYMPNTYFCTFNGLMIAALKMIDLGMKRIVIVDCDMHYGDGTDDIITNVKCTRVGHWSFGKYFHSPQVANDYLEYLAIDGPIAKQFIAYRPDLIIYQSGADVHVNDPMGGVLNEEQMMERDRRMFTIAKSLGIPLAWCLAGGYQVDSDGSIGTVIRLHLNTFRACEEVY